MTVLIQASSILEYEDSQCEVGLLDTHKQELAIPGYSRQPYSSKQPQYLFTGFGSQVIVEWAAIFVQDAYRKDYKLTPSMHTGAGITLVVTLSDDSGSFRHLWKVTYKTRFERILEASDGEP